MLDPYRQGLREFGYVEGRNLSIEFRFAEGKLERLPDLLADLLRLKPDILVTSGPSAALLAQKTPNTPAVVALAVDDPVAMGLAATYARPGGNVTGVSGPLSGILPKRLQLLKDIVPKAQRFAILSNSDSFSPATILNDLPGWERGLSIKLQLLQARDPGEFDAAFQTMVADHVDGVAVLADPVYYVHRAQLGALSVKHRLPSVWGGRDYFEAGGVVSYQGDFPALFRRADSFIDKILKGSKPGDIPFEQVAKLELVVNLKAARALGLTIPRSLLVSADELIE